MLRILARLGLLALLSGAAPSIAGEPVKDDPATHNPAKKDPEGEETSSPLPPPEFEPDPWLGDDEPLLSGPRLSDEPQERTLVQFSFNGNLRRLDRTPEEAALDALNLSGSVRDRAEEILLRRRSTLDEGLRGDLGILLALQRARQAGNKPESEPLVAALTERIETMNGPLRLRDEIAGALPEAERREFHRMIDEYWRTLVLDEVAQAQTRRETLSLAQARIRVTLNCAANELRRAFERRCKPGDDSLDDLPRELSLTEEQEKKVGAPIRELAGRKKPKPSAREMYDLTNKVLPQLDAHQRQIWSIVILGVSPLITPLAPGQG